MSKVAEEYTHCIERVAREHAAEIGFDIQNAPHGLARMIMAVLSSQELRARAMEYLKQDREEEVDSNAKKR